jgi:hypothetical protein
MVLASLEVRTTVPVAAPQVVLTFVPTVRVTTGTAFTVTEVAEAEMQALSVLLLTKIL